VAKNKKNLKKTSKISVIEGSGNIFADLGFDDAEELLVKAELTRQICNRIKSLNLTQTKAAKRLGISQPDVSKLIAGRYSGFSADRLIALLNDLSVDVEITLRPHKKNDKKRGVVRIIESSNTEELLAA